MSTYSHDYYEAHKDAIKRSNYASRQRNLDAVHKRQAEYQRSHPEKTKVWTKNRDVKLKAAFLDMYGGRCQCCGETEVTFLTIDHVQGQVGMKKKEAGPTAMRKAIKQYDPTCYRVLCMNCNHAVRYGRTCPHQLRNK